MSDVAIRRPRANRRVIAIGGAIAALLAIGVAVARTSSPRAPVVDRATVWIDTVKRGPLVRDVQGAGSLVPEQIRWLTATTAAKVGEVRARSGATVEAEDVVIVLENPDMVLASLEADRQVAAAQADLVKLEARTNNEHLAQEAAVVALSADATESARRAQADDELARKGFLSALEMAQSRGRAEALDGRVTLEKKRLGALDRQTGAEIAAQRAQVERLTSIADFRRRQLDDLKVRAGTRGVLEDVPLQVGQWVTPGAVLGKVAQPDKLKAELKIAETLAKDVSVGQPAVVDTRNGVVNGKVVRIDGSVLNGTVKVDVGFDGPLPPGARPDLSVDGRIEVARIPDARYVTRPPALVAEGAATLFKVTGDHALRVPVKLGRTSVKFVEVLGGLEEGDSVIVSDTSAWASSDRVTLK
jgi:multidrug resistance efflux pump